jgi:CDP-glycerol glycerophosphotransferase
VFPIKNKKLVITNCFGKGFGDNSKYIAEEILKKKLECDLVWIVDDSHCGEKFPSQIRTVRYGSLIAKYEETTAKIWIDNFRKDSSVRKRKGQFYIQTWHGGVALKKIEKDVEKKLNIKYLEDAKNDSLMADLFISNSQFCTDLYRKSFWYYGAILECGYPRNDVLINSPNVKKEKVIRYFELDDDTKIILYAPTFRDDYNMEAYNLDYEMILKIIENTYEGKWIFLIRMHPNISERADTISYNSKLINATHYNDMQEIMAASDILITDYSSTMFEFMLMKKPVFLFATDLEKFKVDRDLYFDIYSLPFPVAENNQKLVDNITSFNEPLYLKNVSSFKKEIGLIEDGTAAKKIVEIIEEILASVI